MTITQVLDRIQAAATGGAVDASGQEPRLRDLAAQFEAVLLGQMLREMQSSMFTEEEDTGISAGPLVDALFTELAVSLSRAGGLGVGAAMVEPLSRQADAALDGARTGMLAPSAFSSSSRAAATPTFEIPWTPPPTTMAALGGRVTSAYGWREDPIDATRRFHRGTDIALPEGHDVPAARAGRISFAGRLPGYGLTVTIDHGGGVATRYAHLSALGVEVGQQVAAGEVVAKSGQTGRATGPHLHFELLEDGNPTDPSRMFGGMTNK